MDEAPLRCGFVAIIGVPNVGKSTLVNRLVGSKVSIVSPKVQTTRTRVTGIGMVGNSQIIFVDTPGIFAPNRRLDRAMVSAAWVGAEEADEIVLLLDAPKTLKSGLDNMGAVTDFLPNLNRKIIVVLNKIDGMKRENLLGLAALVQEKLAPKELFIVSALTGDGVADLAQHLAKNLPVGPWHYPEDQLADISERLLAAEIVREKVFLRLHDELPYHITVETEKFEERDDGSARIEMAIFVAREGQKAIVLGKGGRQIKEIGQLAREELAEILDRKVHLFLFVKVRENWMDDPERYREMGLDWTK